MSWLKFSNGRFLKVAGDGFEFVDRRARRYACRANGCVKAVIEVVVDQSLLGLMHGALDGVKLLCQIDAGPTLFDHLDHLLQMTGRATQALDDGRMRLVGWRGNFHGEYPILPDGIGQSHFYNEQLWDYTMFGVVVLHWTLVLTVALAYFIVRVMKGPAYVADAYALPVEKDEPVTRL